MRSCSKRVLEILDERERIIDMQQYARKRWNERKAKYNILGNAEK